MVTLVTGATGTIGRQVAEELLAQNAWIRLGARRPSALGSFSDRGAQIALLDYDVPESFPGAFADVDRLFLVGPAGEGFGDRVGSIARAAREAGVEFILRISGFGADLESPLALSREQAVADQALAESGGAWAALRPTFFQENPFKFQRAAIESQGAFYGSSGEGRTAYVSTADIARCAAAILLNPKKHDGKTYDLTGPEALTDEEVAALASEILEREIRYVDLPPEQLTQGMIDAGTPPWYAEQLVGLENVKREGWAAEVSKHVKKLTGKAPESLRDFLIRNRENLL